MKAVLDTNVLVSAQLNPRGTPAEIVAAWREGRFDLVTTAALIEEFRGTMDEPRLMRRVAAPERIAGAIDALTAAALRDEPVTTLHVIVDDPDDNRVLEAAVAGEADYIVSGDRHLLALGEYEVIPIVRPAQFLALLAAEER